MLGVYEPRARGRSAALARAVRQLWPSGGWQWAALLVATCVLLPLLALLWTAAQGSDAWLHVATHVLPNAAWNTLRLLLGVGVLVVVLGTGAAWLVTAYDFPGRRLIAWALLLPLAVPTYIVAYAYLDVLHPLGPVQGLIRDVLGYDSPRDFRLPDIRGLLGCIVLLGLVLYPYVYISARAMFMTQAASLLEAGRSLGASRAAVFWRVALPLARPAIAVGAALALLETLNDIGASEFLGVQTLTVSVYTTWVTRSDLAGAAQIALAMLAGVTALVALERYGRRRQGYANTLRPRPMSPHRLSGFAGWSVTTLTLLPVLLGFAVPTGYLAWESGQRVLDGAQLSPDLMRSLANTLYVALIASVLTLLAGLLLAWAWRLAQAHRRTVLATAVLRVGALGYAVPGTVLAIGLLVPLAGIDSALFALLEPFGLAPRNLMLGSMAALVVAYMVRFLTISVGGVEAGLTRIPLSLDQAARSLGTSSGRMLWRVHLPLLRPSLAAAALLIFVDVMKELPATLLLRPLNFETLATWLYADAARGAYEEGAVAALLIVLAGLVPVMLLARLGNHKALEAK